MRALALAAAMALLGGCHALTQQVPGALAVRSAQLGRSGGAALLEVGLDCRLSGPMQDALDHGIPLTLALELQAGRWPARVRAHKRLELRYFPLSRRYQLRDLDADDVRSFATPAYLLAALGALRLSLPADFASLPAATPLRITVALDPAALPGALRLPALFEPAWRLASAEHTWLAAAH